LHIFDAQITAIASATPSIRVLRLAIPDAGFRFLPGQWVDLSIEADGTTHTAGYSIITSPLHRGGIELAIKASARHPVARWVHEHARTGDTVRVSQGQGPFVYLPEMSDNVVLIGGGVGVTPLLSIFRHAMSAMPAFRPGHTWSTAYRTAAKSCSARNSTPRPGSIPTCM